MHCRVRLALDFVRFNVRMVATIGDGSVTTHMYVCGGYDGTNRLDSVQEYSIETDAWRTATSVGHPIWGGNLATHEPSGSIWCVGGYDGTTILDTTRIYLPSEDSEDCWCDVLTVCG